MKKILFTLLIVAGGFVAQAQDTITIRYFSHSDSNTYAVAYAEDDNEQCIEASLEQVFSYNSSTSILSINGNPIPAFTNQTDINYWNGVFERSSLFVVPVNGNNQATGGPIAGVTFN